MRSLATSLDFKLVPGRGIFGLHRRHDNDGDQCLLVVLGDAKRRQRRA
ncbi:hypothetical protein [Mycolicibacterium moriokaense]|nr:hypothetical protein [Mycolicibacterium moriokaense]